MYYINFHYAVSIYNDDYSALDDLECQEIQDFLNNIDGGLHFDFDDTQFVQCKLTGYFSDCVRYWIE